MLDSETKVRWVSLLLPKSQSQLVEELPLESVTDCLSKLEGVQAEERRKRAVRYNLKK